MTQPGWYWSCLLKGRLPHERTDASPSQTSSSVHSQQVAWHPQFGRGPGVWVQCYDALFKTNYFYPDAENWTGLVLIIYLAQVFFLKITSGFRNVSYAVFRNSSIKTSSTPTPLLCWVCTRRASTRHLVPLIKLKTCVSVETHATDPNTSSPYYIDPSPNFLNW